MSDLELAKQVTALIKEAIIRNILSTVYHKQATAIANNIRNNAFAKEQTND